MRKNTILPTLVVLGIVALISAGALLASMGFELSLRLYQGHEADPPFPGSATGTNYIGLPYNQAQGLQTARDLFLDIGSQCGVVPQYINRHRKIDNQFDFYTFGGGSLPPDGWNLVPGEAYVVKVGGYVGDYCDYIVVGAHNPGLTITFLAGAAGVSADGTNYYAHPYHGIAANARELFMEIGAGVQYINKHRKSDDQFDFYTFGGGNLPPNGWDLRAGEGYIVKVGTDIEYRPAHY